MASHELPSPVRSGALQDESHLAHPDLPPEANPNEAHDLIEPLPTTEFLVAYQVSGLMLVYAPDEAAASQKAVASLQAVIEKSAASDLPPGEKIELRDTNVVIESAEALEFPQELPNAPESEHP